LRHRQAQFNLGMLYAKLGQLEAAERALRRAVELKPDEAVSNLRLGQFLFRVRGRKEEGMAFVKRAMKLDRNLVRTVVKPPAGR